MRPRPLAARSRGPASRVSAPDPNAPAFGIACLRLRQQDFGLLIDIDEFLLATEGAEDSLDYERFRELLA
jgi:hypothetical protein